MLLWKKIPWPWNFQPFFRFIFRIVPYLYLISWLKIWRVYSDKATEDCLFATNNKHAVNSRWILIFTEWMYYDPMISLLIWKSNFCGFKFHFSILIQYYYYFVQICRWNDKYFCDLILHLLNKFINASLQWLNKLLFFLHNAKNSDSP